MFEYGNFDEGISGFLVLFDVLWSCGVSCDGFLRVKLGFWGWVCVIFGNGLIVWVL